MTDTPDTENVIPPNELERRRRVFQCTEDIADFCKDIADRAMELSEIGVPVADWMMLVAERVPSPGVQAIAGKYVGLLGPLLDGFISARRAGAKTATEGVASAMTDLLGRSLHPMAVDAMMPVPNDDLSWEGRRMERVISRLLKDAPKMTDASGKVDETQAPALMCHVMLKAGGGLQGTLSTTPEGGLRLLQPNTVQGKPVMIEHFFDYEQVADIAVFREVNASAAPRIITS